MARPCGNAGRDGLVCEQSFKPDAEALQHAGFEVRGLDAAAGNDEARYPLVLVLPPRQRDESRALFARAIAATAPGGRVLACVANNEGAKSAEADLRQLAGPVANLTKHKCRVFWTAPLDGPADPALAAQWAALDAVRPIGDGRFVSRPGVFAWDRIDPASRVAGRAPAGRPAPAAPPTSAPASATCRRNCWRAAPASTRSTCTKPKAARCSSRARTWPRPRRARSWATTGTT